MNILSLPENFLRSKGIKNPQVVIYGSLAVIAGITVFIIFRKIRNKQEAKWTDKLSSSNIVNTTITKGDAIIISQNLLNAMNIMGTDVQAITDNLSRCKTKDDLNLVIETFDMKPYGLTGLATFITKPIAKMKNLQGWLRAELSGQDLRDIQAIFNNLSVTF